MAGHQNLKLNDFYKAPDETDNLVIIPSGYVMGKPPAEVFNESDQLNRLKTSKISITLPYDNNIYSGNFSYVSWREEISHSPKERAEMIYEAISAKDKYGNINTIDIPVVVEELLLQSNSPTNITLNPNGTSKFEISTNCNSAITYSSSDPNIAAVDNSGNIIAKSSGSTTITAYVKGKQISTNVVVSNPQPARNTGSSNHHNNSSFSNDDISYTVYKTKTGDCYHRSGCRYLSRSCIPISKSNAVSEGLRACSVCNP